MIIMKTLEEVFNEELLGTINPRDFEVIADHQKYIFACMRSYAEEYARYCLQCASENAYTEKDLDEQGNIAWFVNEKSIVGMPLPKHK